VKHVIRLSTILWFVMSWSVMTAFAQVSGQWKVSVSTPVGSFDGQQCCLENK
jgi:hypothetical protein